MAKVKILSVKPDEHWKGIFNVKVEIAGAVHTYDIHEEQDELGAYRWMLEWFTTAENAEANRKQHVSRYGGRLIP